MKIILKSAVVLGSLCLSVVGPLHMGTALAAGAAQESAKACSALADDSEILWFARILYSETKDADEMRLIAWVVRNRVETDYRGDSYESVAKSPGQFSGLAPSDPNYKINTTLDYDDTQIPTWQTALSIAKEVYYAPDSDRPFPVTVRHFYSPVSVSTKPSWATSQALALVVPSDNSNTPRFAFYSGVK